MIYSNDFYKIIENFAITNKDCASNFDVEWVKLSDKKTIISQSPSLIAGPVNFEDAENLYRSQEFQIPESGYLKIKDCKIVGYGLVVSEDCVILDENFTMPRNEIGHFGYFTDAHVEESNFCFGREYESAGKIRNAVLLMRRGDNVHGHWLLEILPRIPLAQKAADEGLVYIVSEGIPNYQIEMLVMLGISEDLIYKMSGDKCIECENLIIPSVAHTNRYWINPIANIAYNRIHELVRKETRIRTYNNYPSKIFITRSSRLNDPRPVVDGQILEIVAANLGYTIVDPGCVSWKDQVELFAGAKSVVGYLGSGLHNTVFTGSNAHVLAIQSNQTWNHLQTSIASIRSHKISYLFGEALDGFNEKSWETAFRVDEELMEFILMRFMHSD